MLRAPGAASQFASAFRGFRPERLPWLALAALAETGSLTAAALAARRLLRAGRRELPLVSLLGLTVASTAVVDLVPAGVAPASAWLVEQYHRREVPVSLGLWSLLAGGFAPP
ncbi:MAG: hypothetical protein IVW52_17140 [Acidimicrobiales bacterium]|nr:hypothetical protein [Acidimicrobiales bacterium]